MHKEEDRAPRAGAEPSRGGAPSRDPLPGCENSSVAIFMAL